MPKAWRRGYWNMKKRLDVLLVERGLSLSREQARRHIMAGEVFVDGQREDKSGSAFPDEAVIELKGESLKYASRGGYKLEKALEVFPIELGGRICMDIGASTGGFTDCMLQNGDERVVYMEKTNFRYMKREDLPERPDFASADVSFISLDKILPPAYEILADEAGMVCLIKPQFEAGREKVGKNGVVRDRATHCEVIEKCLGFAASAGFVLKGLDFSPIKGPKGNIEYLMYIRKGEDSQPLAGDSVSFMELVDRAHEDLNE